jgi:hypothetical protein
MLLDRGADITTLGPDRKTAADMAEKNGYDDLARVLRAP